MNLKQAALDLARAGFAVFPLQPRDKRPAVKDWPNLATKDEKAIAAWWDENPAYNIGVATGAPSGGLVVIDLDVGHKEGSNGVEFLKAWAAENKIVLPVTASARTGGGGKHLYFRDSTPHKNAAGLIEKGSGIDIRGDGGYVVAPGSIAQNGRAYEWIDHPLVVGIAAVDHGVSLLLQDFGAKKPDRRFKSPELISQGERNSTLYKTACSLRARNLGEEAIRAALVEENNTKCAPPLSPEELDAIFRSAMKHAPGAQPKAPRQLVIPRLVPVSDIEEKTPEWIIDGYLPKGELTILAGDGGVGKTSVWCALAAAISSGSRPFLLDNRFTSAGSAPRDVLCFSSEDSFSYVLRERLRKNGADLRRIKTLECGAEGFSDLTLSGAVLDKLLDEHRPALCVFDPLQAFIGGVDMKSRSEMREALKRLHEYGEKYGTSFLIAMHTNKQQCVWGRNRLADSADIWDIARSVLIVGRSGEQRYISHEKNNYGPQQQTVLFRISEEQEVVFQGTSQKRDKDFILEASRIARSTPALETAKDFITSYLSDCSGSCTPKNLEAAAIDYGLSLHTLRRGKEELRKEGKIHVAQGAGHEWVITQNDP